MKRQQSIEKVKKKFIDNLKKMIANKQISFHHPSIQQSLQDYMRDNTDEEELRDYMNNLVKYKLIRMNYEPNKIILKCNHFEDRYNQLTVLYKNNPNIKHLTIYRCNINLNNIKLISEFTNLRELVLIAVNLQTTSGFYIKNLNKIITLKIQGDKHLKLIDYENITSMQTITHLDLYHSIILSINNGKIFKLIGDMKQLRVLNLANTAYNTHTINDSYYSEAIKNLPNLEVLNLKMCQLSGSCLSNLKTRSLSDLNLSVNMIDNEGIKNISKINSLRVLKLNGNDSNGNNLDIQPIFNMKNLEELELSDFFKFTTLNLSNIKTTSLSLLNLSSNDINNEDIENLSKINSLKILNLSDIDFDEEINLQPLFNMTQLKELDLSNNQLRNEDIIGIDKLKNTKINLDGNDLN